MSDRHVVVGAGPVGTHLARLLVARGSEVVLVSRRGVGVPGATAAALDAADTDGLTALTEGAVALYNCVNPADYTQWQSVWPPIARSLRTVAERTGAVLAVTGCLYPYGPVPDGVMREGMPDAATDAKGVLRASMWAELADAHRAGTLRAVEVRASDYVGTGVGPNGHVTRVLPAARAGRTAWVVDAADVPHSFTDVLDEARALIAVVDDPSTWGQVWHAPTNPPVTLRRAIGDVLEAAGLPPVPVRVIPRVVTRAGGLVVPMMRELNALSYQRTQHYEIDSTRSQETLRLAPTPWEEVCRRTGL
ncbi:NAD-dependent epimerase/dehydratase family protein [Rhodococcoides corynebacterioides]|uniref:NAD-dependent epimerase/dehydratase family protein n=2 Tax=Rhodococcoides corynebacterioides TaxID=53972 RepID=UPI0008330520|nr:NAD-dependent epimerase/dehydratase family protein [Rhodococcus corynebacterioides]